LDVTNSKGVPRIRTSLRWAGVDSGVLQTMSAEERCDLKNGEEKKTSEELFISFLFTLIFL